MDITITAQCNGCGEIADLDVEGYTPEGPQTVAWICEECESANFSQAPEGFTPEPKEERP